jgi:NTP pyrophosphatase (non-canonical NTP hydrolase)
MEFNTYQEQAKKTIQKNASAQHLSEIVPFLGIIGEIGSVVSQLKIKLRVGDSYVAYKTKLSEELGDVLWYVSTIASQNQLTLEEVATQNLEKIHDRFMVDDSSEYKDFDISYPDNEKFPDEFEIEFISFEQDGKKKLKIIDKRDNRPIGDLLTDNTYEEDGYRF